jgi:outer membrane protein assembly factor BamB
MKRILFLAAVFLSALVVPRVQAHDWVTWRGPTQDGVGYEANLPDRWSPRGGAGSNLIWKQPYGGRGTPIIMKGRCYTIRSVGEGLTAQEQILCFNAETGEPLWHIDFNVFLTDIDILRLGWTQIAGDPETGFIYAHGTQGVFVCINGENGQTVWEHSLTEEYGRVSGYGGRLSSPVVDGNLVIIGMINASWGAHALPGQRWLAVDKRTGEPVWWSASPVRPMDTYASVPVVAVINNQRLLITGGGDGNIHALRVRTGEPVWMYTVAAGGVSSSAVVDGNLVYICHGEANPNSTERGGIFCLDASKVTKGQPALVWKKYGIRVRYTSPLLHDGKLYVADENARLHCFDAKTGKQLWRQPFAYGRNAKGSPVWGDGKIYVADVNSHFNILRPLENRCEKLQQQFFPGKNGQDVELNGNAALANGRVYFMTSEAIYCLGKPGKATSPSIPRQRKESLPGQVAKVAHIQIVPADVVLAPGGGVNFHVRTYDKDGRYLGELNDPKLTLAPMQLPPPLKQAGAPNPPPLKGHVGADGRLTVDGSLPGQFGHVVAQEGNLTTTARVRVAPQLACHEDFQDVPPGATPAGWVNTQGKFVVVPLGGSNVLKKLTNLASPLFARANSYMAMPGWGDYTIESDMMAEKTGEDLSDMGLTNSRYHLILDGNKQILHIVSWESTPRPRIDKEIEYQWHPKVWYRMKMSANVHGDKALIQGKVWPREQPEPDRWLIQFEDPRPNNHGSPALYAFAHGIQEGEPSTVYYANVKVTLNARGASRAPRPAGDRKAAVGRRAPGAAKRAG